MKELQLINSVKKTYIDDEDFNKLSQYKWYLNKDGYVFRYFYNKRILLHRQIMNVKDRNILVDHIDNNPLNNCKNNLRFATVKENSYNHKKYKNNTSGYKGIFYHKEIRKKANGEKYIKEYWKVILTKDGKQITKKFPYNSQGKEAACIFYNEKAKEHFGNFAKLNELKK